MGIWAAASSGAYAASPPANTLIGNQASATYNDASNNAQIATSNLVQTMVQQVGSFALVGSNTKNAAPGNTAYMPHTLTNTGNGADTFTLELLNNAGTFDFSVYAIYADANGDGLPDSITPLATGAAPFITPQVAAGGSFGFVVALTVPAVAGNAQTDNAKVTATAGTPALYTTSTANNLDTVNVLATSPVFSVTKSISTPGGKVSAATCAATTYAVAGCYKTTYTLTYTNTGTAAGPLYLKDVIGAAGVTAGFEYIAGSAAWSNGAGFLTDAAGGDASGIDFQVVTVAGASTLEAVIASVGPNVTGKITFDVGIKSTATPGTTTTTNTANFDIAIGGTTVATNTATGGNTTNPSVYTVLPTYGLVANNGANVALVPTDGTNLNVAGDDQVLVATAAAGATVPFSNTIWNTGNASDAMNIVPSASTFPAGTVISLYMADGVTPLIDSNGDGVVDTGPMAAGSSQVVVLKAKIPGAACPAGVCPAGPFAVQVTATSVGDSTRLNQVFDQLTALTAPSVSLVNAAPAAVTPWAGTVAAAVDTKTVNAGASASFDLVVNNGGTLADNYDLAAMATTTAAPVAFSAGSVPAGWTIVFHAGVCSASGSNITNTGNVPAGGSVPVCAVVTAPASSAAGTTDVYFQISSPVSGAGAIMRDAVTITSVAKMLIAPNQSGQINVGGTLVYAHTVTNTGNVSCVGPLDLTVNIPAADVAAGWTAVIYDDVSGTGQITAANNVITSLVAALPVGGTSPKLLVKVFAPGGASAGAVSTLTITATDAGVSACSTSTATDTSTVIAGQVRLDKQQARDTACTGTPNGLTDTTYSAAQFASKPGECVLYQITATNQGNASVTGVVISDGTPAYTVYNSGPTCTAAGVPAAPAVGAVGTVSCSFAAPLIPGAQVMETFGVKINP